MAGTCKYLGIYEQQIEDAGDVLDLACEQYGLDEQKLWKAASNWLYKRLGIFDYSCMSNVVCACMFDALRDALCQQKGIAFDRTEYYCNGELDTHFWVDGEEIA